MLETVGWLQKYVRISQGLHKLNKDYGKGLAKLVKKESRTGDEANRSSISISHGASLAQLSLLAGRHKEIAVSLGNLSREYETHVKRLLDQHKQVEAEARKLKGDLDNSVKKLDKSRVKFERRQQEADCAEDTLTKVIRKYKMVFFEGVLLRQAEPDARVSRAELDKIKDAADDTKARAARAREEYSVQLNLTNGYQRGFYR